MDLNKLHKDTDVGVVTLFVMDLDRMTEFYADNIGLDVLEKNENFVTLGHKDKRILELHKKDLHFPDQGEAGLYHTAIVFSERSHLANTLRNVFKKSPRSFEGSGDHFVSQAFYFHDPEGNGLELYYDRPKEEWKWEDGKIVMGTVYIDPAEFVLEHAKEKHDDSEAKVGHIHLKVGDIAKAKEFYVDILGFDVTAQLPSALFVSAGGYHHHLGLNTWESIGAKERGEVLGLGSFEILLPDKAELEKVEKRLLENKIEFEKIDNVLETRDPWGNRIFIRT